MTKLANAEGIIKDRFPNNWDVH